VSYLIQFESVIQIFLGSDYIPGDVYPIIYWIPALRHTKVQKVLLICIFVDLSVADFHVYLLKVEFKVIHYIYCSIPF